MAEEELLYAKNGGNPLKLSIETWVLVQLTRVLIEKTQMEIIAKKIADGQHHRNKRKQKENLYVRNVKTAKNQQKQILEHIDHGMVYAIHVMNISGETKNPDQ